MKITDLEIDGFGVWKGLELKDLSHKLTVFYGANEAGKTTLMQFVRAICFGFDGKQFRRYVPPVHGGRPGGSLCLHGDEGALRLVRHWKKTDDGSWRDKFEVTDDRGRPQGERALSHFLSGIDELTFTNVFVFGLRELQELATLNDTEAAKHLYKLAGGFDRVSLVEVRRELAASRQRLLDTNVAKSQIGQLSAKRRDLIARIEELTNQTRQWAGRSIPRDDVNSQIDSVQQELDRLRDETVLLELAVTIREPWHERTAMDAQLAELDVRPELPDRAIEDFEGTERELQECTDEQRKLKNRRKKFIERAKRVPLNSALERQRSRIESLRDQAPSYEFLLSQTNRLRAEIDQLRSRLRQLSAPNQTTASTSGERTGAVSVHSLAPQAIEKLQRHARGLRGAKRRLAVSKRRVKTGRQQSNQHHHEIRRVLDERGEPNLSTAVENTGQYVDTLRQRVHVDERLQQLQRHRQHLDHESGDWLERQVMTNRQILGTGALFVAGSMLLLAAMFGGISALDISNASRWLIGFVGIGMTLGAVISKTNFEHHAERKRDDCRKQITLVTSQFEQVSTQRDQLDEILPPGGGPFAVQLQSAERDLESLQQLLPLDTGNLVEHEGTQAGRASVVSSAQRYKKARDRWRQALSSFGLPELTAPQDLDDYSDTTRETDETTRQLESKDADLEQKEMELTAFRERVRRIFSDAHIEPEQDEPCEQLEQLALELLELETQAKLRRRLRFRARQLGKRQRGRSRVLTRLRRRQRSLWAKAGASNEEEFRRVALETRQAKQLERQRKKRTEEISLALGTQAEEAEVVRQLHGGREKSLDERLERMWDRQQTLEKRLRTLDDQSGRRQGDAALLENDRRLARFRLDLACADAQLEQAVERWKVLAVTSHLIDRMCSAYEAERQPEALQIASGYLEDLTSGRYLRIRTPLDQEELRIETAAGELLEVESLSCGTREQLLLSLRLALVSIFARRGACFPLVLDDVLVNFDVERSKAAGRVLHEFAKAGHQVILFTCHEHMMKLLRSLRVDVRELPNHSELAAGELAAGELAAGELAAGELAAGELANDEVELDPPKRRRKRRKKKEKPQVTQELEVPVDESPQQEPVEPLQIEPDKSPLSTVVESEPVEAVVEPDAEATAWLSDVHVWDEQANWHDQSPHGDAVTAPVSRWDVSSEGDSHSAGIDTLRDFLERHAAHPVPADHFTGQPPAADREPQPSADARRPAL